jgi:hypothetical protein
MIIIALSRSNNVRGHNLSEILLSPRKIKDEVAYNLRLFLGRTNTKMCTQFSRLIYDPAQSF